MKVLVTGATGFLGKYVIEYLLSKDIYIIATGLEKCDDFITSSKKLAYIQYDINSSVNENTYKLFHSPDIMLHMAWEGLSDYKSSALVEKTLVAHSAFLRNIIDKGLKNLAVTGTCLEYGLKEGCLNEETPTEPVTNYGIAKDTLRKFLQQLKVQYRFNFNWLRLFYMYGQGQHPKSLIPQLEQAILNKQPSFDMSKGDQQRDYLPVEKVAEYIVDIALKQKDFGVVNCCSGKPVTVKSFAEEYLSKKNAKIQLNLGAHPYPDYEPFAFWGDNSKLKKLLYE